MEWLGGRCVFCGIVAELVEGTWDNGTRHVCHGWLTDQHQYPWAFSFENRPLQAAYLEVERIKSYITMSQHLDLNGITGNLDIQEKLGSIRVDLERQMKDAPRNWPG